ncbi:aminotransferase class V-fold PLP-dependent enzyme [Melioribacteraceae bacterium 4301-Me]|uniref:aminotransferase class V-fold PLP-dependent enzyme n=1 Tax=Pyranulibacter aquaticus TaxID=3163344 RepID=UPI00359BC5FA
MNIKEVRNQFPHIAKGKIYFNHAAIGPLSTPVVNKLNEYIYQRSEGSIDIYELFLNAQKNSKEKLAKILNVGPERISFVQNVSSAISIIAQGLKWKVGDRIILNDMEFPSNVYPFLNLKSEGVEIDFVKSSNGAVQFDEIEKAVTRKTKLISISLVQFVSGFRADVEKIGELCKLKGIIFCIDGIQGIGVVDTDMQRYQADFIAGGSQKWLMGLQGTSFFYISKDLQDKVEPKVVGWTSVVNAWNLLNYDLTLRENADRFQSGTMSAIGVCALNESLNLFTKIGMKNIEEQILSNTEYFNNKLLSIGVRPILADAKRENLSGIVSFRHKKSEQIFTELGKRNIICSLREGVIRFSPHFYNTKEEIDFVIDELKLIISKL